MAEIKISELDLIPSTPSGPELLAIVQADGQSGLDTYQATIDDLKPALEDNLSTGAPTWTTGGVLRAGHDIIAGYVDSGASTDGGGTIGLTLNDGYGDANITFNHTGGIPDRAGSSARITSSVDSNQELLDFQLKGGTTTGSVATLTSVLQLRDDKISLLQPTLLSTNGSATTSLVNKGYIDDADTAETDARISADSANLTAAKNHANSLVAAEATTRSAADTTLTNDLSDLTAEVAGKIGETEIDTLAFTFANDTLSLNIIKEGQIGTGAVTTTKIDDYNITANKLVGTESIQANDFLIYDSNTGGFQTTASTITPHKLFSNNHTDVDSSVTPSYGDSMYYNGTEWITGNFGNYGADMEYMPISGASNVTYTNLTWANLENSSANMDSKEHYDAYFTLPAGQTFTDLINQATPQSGVFTPFIHNLAEDRRSGVDVSSNDYDATLNDTTRVGFGSWWNAYGGSENAHSVSGSIQFPLANLTGTGLVNRNIRGLFIRVHNWHHDSNSNRRTELYISYPDGSKKPLSESIRRISESGSLRHDLNQVLLVPVNEGQSQIEIDFNLIRNQNEGVEFEIVGAQCTKRVELSPDVDIIQIVGSQLSEQSPQGYVDENTSTFVNSPSVFTSEDPATTGATDWSGVFPIEIPDNVSKSVISIVNNWNYNAAANEEIDHITITVDWNANTIFGTYTWGSEYESNGFLYSTDLVGEKTFTINENLSGHAWQPLLIKFELNGRSIVKLPCPSHGGYPSMGQKYTIENYKTNAISTYKSYDNSFGFFFDPPNHQGYSTFFGSSYISKDSSFIFSGGGGTYQLNGASPAAIPSYSRVQIPLQTGEKVIEYYYSGDNYVSAFVLTDRGRVFGAGYGGTGQLGQGDLSEQKSFQLILEDVAWLSVGNGNTHYVHCLAILNDGTAYSWGNNNANELGRGSAQTYNNAVNMSPGQIPGFGEGAANGKAEKAFAFNSISNGKSFIITEDRKVWSCGSVSSGGLGHATAKSLFADTGREGDYLVANSTEANKSVFIVDGTDLWAAGDNAYGQLGLGNTTNGFLFQQVTLTNGVSQISTAGTTASTIVIETDGGITVFGYNALGQLGTGDLTQRNSPTTIAALGTNNKKVKLFGPDSYVAAYILKTDGTVFVSGYNGHGQLGTGDLTNRSTFTKMAKEDRVFIKDFQLFGYDHYNAFVGADQDDNLWGVGYNISYKFLSTTNGIGGDRSVLTKIDAVDGVDASSTAQTGLGYDQTWVSFSNAARNITGTSYYNDTGKPIEVKGYFGGGSDAHNIHIHLTPLGGSESQFTFATSTNSGGGVSSNGSMIIPPDTTYRFTKTGVGSVTYYGISELR